MKRQKLLEQFLVTERPTSKSKRFDAVLLGTDIQYLSTQELIELCDYSKNKCVYGWVVAEHKSMYNAFSLN